MAMARNDKRRRCLDGACGLAGRYAYFFFFLAGFAGFLPDAFFAAGAGFFAGFAAGFLAGLAGFGTGFLGAPLGAPLAAVLAAALTATLAATLAALGGGAALTTGALPLVFL